MTLSPTISKGVLSNLHNMFAGERVFILGTGPSLDSIPDDCFPKLKAHHCMGVNYAVNCPRLGFTPNFYCVSELTWWFNEGRIGEITQRLSGIPPIKFYSWPRPIADSRFREWIWVKSEDSGEFMGLGEEFPYVLSGGSVVSSALQIACWLGFREIYLLGVDATERGHAKGLDLVENDFTRSDQAPFIEFMRRAEGKMREAGRQLVDLSPDGRLPLPKSSLVEVLG